MKARPPVRSGAQQVRSAGVEVRTGGSTTRHEAKKRGCLWDQTGSSSQHDRAVMRHRLGGDRMIGVPAANPTMKPTRTDSPASAAPPAKPGRLGAAKAVGTRPAVSGAAAVKPDGSGAVVSTHTHVHHVRQNFKWDCGIACILMLLRTRGEYKGREDLITMAGTNSVWTVDLAYIMHACGLPCVFHTVMDGVREEYAVETFYKDELDEDRARVEKLFRGAKAAGVAVKTETVTIAQIAAAVLQGRLAIVLTDRRILRPKSDETASALRNRTDRVSYKTRAMTSGHSRAVTKASPTTKAYEKSAGRKRCVPSKRDAAIASAELSGSFTGHYVVLCGYDKVTKQFDICDPACDMPRYTVAESKLDAARTSFGTDEDILVMNSQI